MSELSNKLLSSNYTSDPQDVAIKLIHVIDYPRENKLIFTFHIFTFQINCTKNLDHTQKLNVMKFIKSESERENFFILNYFYLVNFEK